MPAAASARLRPFQKLSSLEGGKPSAAIRARVEAARQVQRAAVQQMHLRVWLLGGVRRLGQDGQGFQDEQDVR